VRPGRVKRKMLRGESMSVPWAWKDMMNLGLRPMAWALGRLVARTNRRQRMIFGMGGSNQTAGLLESPIAGVVKVVAWSGD
jgi:hypothetical protein